MPPLNKKIRELRKRLNLSQQEFAESIGFSKSYVANIETGRNQPSRNFLDRVRAKYHVSVDSLLSGNLISDILESGRTTRNPYIIFVYAFTAEGLSRSEKILLSNLKSRNVLLVDTLGLTTYQQALRKLVSSKASSYSLWELLEKKLVTEDLILVFKGLSQSKLPKSGDFIRGVFKIIDDAGREPRSSMIILDYPSYLEKKFADFGYYAAPVYLLEPTGGWVK